MENKNLHIIAACGNGMGTSMLIKIKVEKIMKELGYTAKVEALSMGQTKGMEHSADIIISSIHLTSEFNPNAKAKIVGVLNLMDENEIKQALSKVL
ncbi:PTS sugar transporter subunit IIB [Mycoplasmoides pneumoniae]|uniref:Ascorbate-specific PTS system EIIB component n=1 Tax=Mycoplasma pneumoniae (strain ATCC 29342 / M129 / Subtype 1) TaxID=272634 RepID=ULAB_MYCPN|nr:PTS sugar transporter subunit IIB [Mycoplasmoides pneumoniae]Q9EXD8.1 RecName: Full=Ascorbate-specific PTS system EIIB component; AltName: Full=Ascorbate-specific phosphotransferase enzyme IIB component [Mycoplasmoides pneumoniae M129]AAG34743.1 PTS system: EIIB-like protein [Mycoplasmoides pneumoniae M129]AGC04388.1 PTS ascorbate transporter subunit IIB [Mycoplasmoides pneumoniae M129-B7]ALA30367.1 PTS ascorbate transporter subunit IIB [Mycoplasmoides pneumoniae PI 1428]ALA32473.1 PTS asco